MRMSSVKKFPSASSPLENHYGIVAIVCDFRDIRLLI